MPDTERPLVIVDAANVVGSVPDGWWRDRAAAATRLRDALASSSDTSSEPSLGRLADADVVLVVEGAARGVRSVPGVRVVAASGSGDDMIVELVGDTDRARQCTVVTADRELRRRVQELGADVAGPRSVYPPP